MAVGHADTPNNIAYIDALAPDAYSSDLWSSRGIESSDLWANYGIAGLARTLMRDGYLPLLAPD